MSIVAIMMLPLVPNALKEMGPRGAMENVSGIRAAVLVSPNRTKVKYLNGFLA